MKKSILFIFCFYFLFACNENIKESEETEKVISAKINDEVVEKTIEEREIYGISTVDNLRIRESPYLDSEIVGMLSKNQKVEMLARTDWKEEINKIFDNWYKIKTSTNIGWSFGGYLNFDDSNVENIVVEKIPQKIQTTSNAHVYSDLNKFPIIPMKIFGIEPPRNLTETFEKEIKFDALYEELILLNFDIPEEYLEIYAKDPTGKVYKNRILPDDLTILEENEFGEKYDINIFVIDFYTLSFIKRGEWIFDIIIDGDKYSDFKLNISTRGISVSDTFPVSPFEQDGNVIITPGKLIYIAGISKYMDQEIDVVLYRIDHSDQNEDLSFNLKPQYAVRTKTSESGYYQVRIKIGTDIMKGEYKFASGVEITNVYLFDAWMRVK